jgi:DNA repair protein RecO (recombination protein O)
VTSPPLLRAVVLRTRPFSETSLWVRLYSESHGKITGIAKGGRKGTERMFSPLLEVETKGYPPRAAEQGLWSLARPEIVTDFRDLAGSSDQMAYAFGVLEVCDQLLQEAEPHAAVFHALRSALMALSEAASGQVSSALVWFLIRMADELGYSIQYHVCPRCDTPLVFPVGSFAREAGGVLCRTCSPSETLALAQPVWEGLVTLAEAEAPAAAALRPGVRDTLLTMVTHYLSHHAERPLRLRSLDLRADDRAPRRI